MTDRLDKYSAVLTDLVSEAISCSPSSWDHGTLTIVCDGTRIDYKLKNDGSDEKAVISERLRYHCEVFWSAFRDSGETWHTAEIALSRKDDKWTFSTKFQRAEPRKSAWKFWQ